MCENNTNNNDDDDHKCSVLSFLYAHKRNKYTKKTESTYTFLAHVLPVVHTSLSVSRYMYLRVTFFQEESTG